LYIHCLTSVPLTRVSARRSCPWTAHPGLLGAARVLGFACARSLRGQRDQQRTTGVNGSRTSGAWFDPSTLTVSRQERLRDRLELYRNVLRLCTSQRIQEVSLGPRLTSRRTSQNCSLKELQFGINTRIQQVNVAALAFLVRLTRADCCIQTQIGTASSCRTQGFGRKHPLSPSFERVNRRKTDLEVLLGEFYENLIGLNREPINVGGYGHACPFELHRRPFGWIVNFSGPLRSRPEKFTGLCPDLSAGRFPVPSTQASLGVESRCERSRTTRSNPR
jgi:hypothetical protein